MIIVNFKTYRQALGKGALRLALLCEKVSKKSGISIAVAPQSVDLRAIAARVDIPVLAQTADPVGFGAHTGALIPQAILDSGANGALINHSERPVPLSNIEELVKMFKKLGLISIVCAGSARAESRLLGFSPDLLAIEPPELIGGKVSVSKARPDLIEKSVKRAGSVPVLCGAGVHTEKDVSAALKLGARGVLVASGVVKARNPEQALQSLARGFHKARE
ncbi:triose-phosphate isomerase [Candidatus Woesearchaeota archaeon]|nr:MAG: triose-phosphate isomerase [Candidatus Woesearchaeota archaeon]